MKGLAGLPRPPLTLVPNLVLLNSGNIDVAIRPHPRSDEKARIEGLTRYRGLHLTAEHRSDRGIMVDPPGRPDSGSSALKRSASVPEA